MIARALADYLDGVSKGGFALGERDCCTFMADWLLRLGFPDVMADRRGSYAGVRGFQRLLKAEGGLLAACSRRFAGAGLAVAASPRHGDTAVVRAPYAIRGGRLLMRPLGAIALSDRHFALLSSRHLVISSLLPVERVWTIHA